MALSGKSYLEFGTTSLSKYLRAMQSEADGVKLSDDPESIHRMRVASRRLRTALVIFQDCLPVKKSEKFRKKIRKLAGSLGEARDADVKIEFLKEFLSRLPEKKYNDGIKRLLLRTEQARKKLQPGLVKSIDDAVNNGLFEEMEKAFKNSFQKGKSGNSIRKKFQKETKWRLEEVMEYENIIKLPERVEELHDMRIAVKHLRYCLEFFTTAVGGLDKHVKTVKQMQELLGDIHDCDVWLVFLPDFISDEEIRAFEYCGNAAPVAKLTPGIMYLADDRRTFRQKRYDDFISLWDASGNLFDELFAIIDD